mmetsp:Transcript_10233/g.31397  ORF Transcript_10233/g.31397 Transcript_10233/m.31397 type:complete len:233 (-) Transcript_10233:1836-2534(-)
MSKSVCACRSSGSSRSASPKRARRIARRWSPRMATLSDVAYCTKLAMGQSTSGSTDETRSKSGARAAAAAIEDDSSSSTEGTKSVKMPSGDSSPGTGGAKAPARPCEAASAASASTTASHGGSDRRASARCSTSKRVEAQTQHGSESTMGRKLSHITRRMLRSAVRATSAKGRSTWSAMRLSSKRRSAKHCITCKKPCCTQSSNGIRLSVRTHSTVSASDSASVSAWGGVEW